MGILAPVALEMFQAGYTMQAIGEMYGVSRQRIEQVLRPYQPISRPWHGVVKLAELAHPKKIKAWAGQGKVRVAPGRSGAAFKLYHMDDVWVQVEQLLTRQCQWPNCREIVCSTDERTCYCADHTAESVRNRWPVMSPEARLKHIARGAAWRAANPEKYRAIRERTNARLRAEKK